MENQKIINLLEKVDTDSKHFATKKWYIINDENNTNYGYSIIHLYNNYITTLSFFYSFYYTLINYT